MRTERTNAIGVNDQQFLLTVTPGEAIHLSREAGMGEAGRAALPEWLLSPEREKSWTLLRGCDRAALAEPRGQTALRL